MIASKSIRGIWILGFEIIVCIIIGLIASNALAVQATLAWDPNSESDLRGYRVHYGTVSGSHTVHADVHNVATNHLEILHQTRIPAEMCNITYPQGRISYGIKFRNRHR
jgi:hypothetical protein